MRDNQNQRLARPEHQRPTAQGDYNAAQLIRIILPCMNPDIWPSFISTVTDKYEPDIQVRLYEFVKAMIRSWAGQGNLTREDAGVIEDCRKICDMMGWPPEKW